MAHKLLILEDNPTDSKELEKTYKALGWHVAVADGIAPATRILQEQDFEPQVIIADIGLPDGRSLDNLETLQSYTEFSEWVFLLEPHEKSDSEHLDELAYEYVEKPYTQKRLGSIVQRALRASLTQRRLQHYSQQHDKRYGLNAYIGNSQPVIALKKMLSQLSDVPISAMIINGETGTGKGLVARIVHHNGVRKNGPLIEVNCAAVPRELMESQLFGHEAGAFTGAQTRHRGLIEQADGGTLFLDEIGDMDLDLQAKLLKAIEDQSIRRLGGEKEIQFDVQVIAATAVDLQQAVQENNFRSDLYHRLSVFCVNLPPLRERKEDLAEFVPRFIADNNEKSRRRVEEVPDEVWEKLMKYDWPGNIRELRNVIERCVLLSTSEVFPVEWLQLPDDSSTHTPIGDPGNTVSIPLDGSMALADMDKYIIQTVLERCDNNIAESARLLQTTRETLRYRIQKYHLDV